MTLFSTSVLKSLENISGPIIPKLIKSKKNMQVFTPKRSFEKLEFKKYISKYPPQSQTAISQYSVCNACFNTPKLICS